MKINEDLILVIHESVDCFARFAAEFAAQLAAVLVIENKLATRCGQVPRGSILFHALVKALSHFLSPPDIYSIAELGLKVNRFTKT